MRYYITIFGLVLSSIVNGQSSIDHNFEIDSLLTNKQVFDSTLRIVHAVDSIFNIEKSNIIDTAAKWQFIGSYKRGWKSSILSSDSILSTNFNDIYVSRKDDLEFSFNDLNELIPNNFKFRPDSLGNYYSARIYTTENHLIIDKGHSYPNGSQTSWAYSHKYYFIKKRVLTKPKTN
jgi:hypothetical protein